MLASTAEPLFGHTNVSRPQLLRTGSAHSITASEDYYSLTSSSTHSDDSTAHPPIRRYQTPPSRYRTPMASREHLSKDQTVASGPMKGTGRRRHSDADRSSYPPNPLQAHPRASTITRKPVPSSVYEANPRDTMKAPISAVTMSSAAKELNREPSPPTPGDDDTPYIQFALDQLTRDEEVRGSRVYPDLRPASRRLRDSADTVRPSYVPSADAETQPKRRTRTVSAVDPAYIPAAAMVENKLPEPPQAAVTVSGLDDQPLNTQRYNRPSQNYAEKPLPQPMPPKPSTRGDAGQRMTQRHSAPETFLAFEPPSGVPYLSLDALPPSLRPIRLAAFILVLLLFLSALVFSAVWSTTKGRLWAYGAFADNRYFVFQYLPMTLAVILLFWVFQLQTAVHRVTPFIALASDSRTIRAKASLLPLNPSGFLLPSLAHLSSGLPAIACFAACTWLSLFTIPLLSASFNVYQYGSEWQWLATQGVIWVVIALYTLLLISALWLFVFLWRRQTGLKWDPTSLADILVLLERSNVLDTYVSYFYSPSNYDFKEDLAARGNRLGYWRTSARPNATIHTIGRPYFPSRQYEKVDGVLVEKRAANRTSNNFIDLESGRPYSYGTGRSLLSNRFSRQSAETTSQDKVYQPFLLRPAITILLSITFMSLLLVFLVISYLPSTAISSGFLPALSIPVNTSGYSAANFLYSFIPSLLGLLLFLLWTHIDLTLRRHQPIANLSHASGVNAEHSLLLSYPSDGAVLTTLKALINRDFRVALVSLITLLSSLLPILAGGVFWAQFYVPTQTVRIYASDPAFYALTVIFALSSLGFLALPFTSRQVKPYGVPSPEGSPKVNHFNSLVDIVALTHQSRLLVDAAFHAPASRIQLVTRLLTGAGEGYLALLDKQGGSKASLADGIRGFGTARGEGQEVEKEGRYVLGRYVGRDGKAYVGIDRVGRMGIEKARVMDGEKF